MTRWFFLIVILLVLSNSNSHRQRRRKRRKLQNDADFATVSLPELEDSKPIVPPPSSSAEAPAAVVANDESEFDVGFASVSLPALDDSPLLTHSTEHESSSTEAQSSTASAVEFTADKDINDVDSAVDQHAAESSPATAGGGDDVKEMNSIDMMRPTELRDTPGRPEVPLLINIFDRMHRADVVAFYNVYASGPYFRDIVEGQISRIKTNGLLNHLDAIYYATMGPGGDKFHIDTDKFTHVAHYGDTGEEVMTLGLLYDYCKVNPASKVMYFHDKGSFHQTFENAKFCSILNCYVLTPYCIDALEHADTCGFRITPDPFIHYSGNFWWARCEYINTLIDPMIPLYNKTFQHLTATQLNDCVGAHGRYFAESWIGSAPEIHPADCLNFTFDRAYLWGYQLPGSANGGCPSLESHRISGLPCQKASVLRRPQYYKQAYQHMISLQPPECRNNRAMVVKRSMIWYNQPPVTYLEWMDRMTGAEPLTDGMAVRFSDSTEIFYVENGLLRSIPNMDKFYQLGLNLSQVKVLFATDRGSYHFGPSM